MAYYRNEAPNGQGMYRCAPGGTPAGLPGDVCREHLEIAQMYWYYDAHRRSADTAPDATRSGQPGRGNPVGVFHATTPEKALEVILDATKHEGLHQMRWRPGPGSGRLVMSTLRDLLLHRLVPVAQPGKPQPSGENFSGSARPGSPAPGSPMPESSAPETKGWPAPAPAPSGNRLLGNEKGSNSLNPSGAPVYRFQVFRCTALWVGTCGVGGFLVVPEHQRSGVLLALDASVGETGWAVVDSGSSRMVEATGVIKTPGPRKSALDSRVDVCWPTWTPWCNGGDLRLWFRAVHLAFIGRCPRWNYWRPGYASGPDAISSPCTLIPPRKSGYPLLARPTPPGQLELRGHGTTWPDWPRARPPTNGKRWRPLIITCSSQG